MGQGGMEVIGNVRRVKLPVGIGTRAVVRDIHILQYSAIRAVAYAVTSVPESGLSRLAFSGGELHSYNIRHVQRHREKKGHIYSAILCGKTGCVHCHLNHLNHTERRNARRKK